MKAIGIDGCKAGWVYVAISDNNWDYHICKNISELVSKVDSDAQILIDMPIGLPDKSFRKCDIACREFINKEKHKMQYFYTIIFRCILFNFNRINNFFIKCVDR